MDAPRRTPNRTANLREAAIPILAAIITVSLYAAATPATVRTGADLYAILAMIDTGPIVGPIIGVFLAAVLIAGWAAIGLIEHRLPWPLAPRPRPGNPFWREEVAALCALSFVQWAIADRWFIVAPWQMEHLRPLNDGRYLWVAIPAGFAAGWVASIAAFGVTYVLAHLIIGRWSLWRDRSRNRFLALGIVALIASLVALYVLSASMEPRRYS